MPLRRIDLTLPTPEENLALDEALLRRLDDEGRQGAASGYLRFWESPTCFVVLGVSSRLLDDVHVDRCARDAIPVLRRASGGGTVLQGPGCLNFAIVLPLADRPELQNVDRSYEQILSRLADSLGLEGAGRQGTSDLAQGTLKIGGSAQKRTPRVLLHHGTVLHGFDLTLLSRYLREPERRPLYRGERRHEEFVTNVSLDPSDIRERLARGWDARPVEPSWSPPPLGELIGEKYSRKEWNERF